MHFIFLNTKYNFVYKNSLFLKYIINSFKFEK